MPKKPKVSINKLAEFAGASSTRKQSIVKDQEAPRTPGYKSFRYTESRAACIRYFTSGFDATIIDNAIVALTKKPIRNDYNANDQANSIASLNELKKLGLSQFSGLSFSKFEEDGVLEIEGVDVKICPDLLLRGIYKKNKIVGAIKFHINKTTPLDTDAQSIVSTMLNKYVDLKEKQHEEKALHQFMFSIDIFSGIVQPAPKAQKRIEKNVEDSCKLYKLIWESLSAMPLTT